MDDQTINIKELLNNIENNNNAMIEIKNHTLYFLQKYENDNLLDLIKSATLRGFSGVEWIDFWGIGGLSLDIIIQSANNIIKKQKLETIIEPYYNNVNHRLGIAIKRCHYKEKIKSLPMEIRNITNKSKKHSKYYYIPNESDFIDIPNSDFTTFNI
jgi:hypothetical protein